MDNNIFNFEKLEVYKKAIDFVNCVYSATEKFPKEERFSLVDQFRRAAISIPLNIAEGYGGSKLEFKRYINIARASIRECVAILTLARMRGYSGDLEESNLRNKCAELSKMLSGLLKSLQ